MKSIFTKEKLFLLTLILGLGFQSNLFADYTCKNVRFEVPITDTNGASRTISKNVATFQLSGLAGYIKRWERCIDEGQKTALGGTSLGSKLVWMDKLGLTPTEKVHFCKTNPVTAPQEGSAAAHDPDYLSGFSFKAFTTKVSNDSKWRNKNVAVAVSKNQCNKILSDHQAAIDAAQAAADAAQAAADEAANRCNFCLYNQKQVYKGCLAKGSKIEKNVNIATCKLRTAKEVMDKMVSDTGASVIGSPSTPITGTPKKKVRKR